MNLIKIFARMNDQNIAQNIKNQKLPLKIWQIMITKKLFAEFDASYCLSLIHI